MDLLQTEADHLLAMPKHLDGQQVISFGRTESFNAEYSRTQVTDASCFFLILNAGSGDAHA